MAGYFDLGSLSPSAQSESGTRAAYDNYQGYENSTGLEFGPQIMRRAGGYQTDVSRDGMIDTKEEGFGLYRDMVIASGEDPIRVKRDPETGEPSPYVHIRAGLEALIDRKSFYRMVDIGSIHDEWFGVWSNGSFFKIIPANELEGA